MKTNSLILLQNRNFSIKMLISLYKWPQPSFFFPYLFLDPPSVSNECLCLWIQAFKRPMYTIYLINHGQHLCNNNISISISLRFIFPRSGDKKNTMSPPYTQDNKTEERLFNGNRGHWLVKISSPNHKIHM